MSKSLRKCCKGSFNPPSKVITVAGDLKGGCPLCGRWIGMLTTTKLAGHYPKDPG